MASLRVYYGEADIFEIRDMTIPAEELVMN